MDYPPAKTLTAAQVEDALTLLARRNGNAAAAARELQERGIEINRRTLGRWKRETYVDRYHELAASLSTEEKDRAISQGFRESIAETQDLAVQIREKLGDSLDDLKPNELPKALQALSITQGVATEKMLLLEGRPTQITETRSPDWYEGQLAALLGGEITDAEVIGEGDEQGG